MNTELILTKDGSHTFYLPEIDECYHSSHGAIQESRHIFIQAGLKQCVKSEINLLEIGFGTGLNSFMTMIEAEISDKKICYTSLEKYPVSFENISQLNYPEEIATESRVNFEKLHTSEWNENVQISPFFSLKKIDADFTDFTFNEMFDVIYFDAFSPEKQPEMWTDELFKTLYTHCNTDAILTTYCAKGFVRRAMQSVGFEVERLPGPPGKREMLRARKKI